MEREEKMSQPDVALSDVVVDQDKAKGERHHFHYRGSAGSHSKQWLLDYGKNHDHD